MPEDNDDYGPTGVQDIEEEDARFFGGGLSAKENEILNYMDDNDKFQDEVSNSIQLN